MKEIANQDQLAGEMIHIRKRKEGGWKAFMTCGIPFEPMASANGDTVADALIGLANKIRNVPIGSGSAQAAPVLEVKQSTTQSGGKENSVL